jgi:hypothetical protein
MEKLIFWCCLGGVSVAVSSFRSLQRDFSFSVFLFSFFLLCASFMPFGHDVVAEAGCIGIFAILINTLYLKKTHV